MSQIDRRSTRPLVRTLFALGVLTATPAFAQTGGTCKDYLDLDAQLAGSLSPADKAAMQADPQAAALDAKMKAYCKANPKASVDEAMMKAAQ